MNPILPKLNLTQAKIHYKELYADFSALSNKVYQDFLDDFEKNFKSLDDVHHKFMNVAGSIIFSAVKEKMHYFSDREIYDITPQSFLSDYVEDLISDVFNDYDEAYLEITMSAEELDEYRTARRKSRGRFYGMGVNGMSNAFMANTAMGIAHGAFNVGAKMLSFTVDAVKKANIYNDKAKRHQLAEALSLQIIEIHWGIAKAVNHYHSSFYAIPTENDLKSAENILHNIKNGNVPEHKIKESLIRCLTLNPFLKGVYTCYLEKYPEENDIILDTASYFGITGLVVQNVTQPLNEVSVEDNLSNTQAQLLLESSEKKSEKKETKEKKQDPFIAQYLAEDEKLLMDLKHKSWITRLYFILGVIFIFAFIPLGILFLLIGLYNKRKYSLRVLLSDKNLIVKFSPSQKSAVVSMPLTEIDHIRTKKYLLGVTRISITLKSGSVYVLDNLTNADLLVNETNNLIYKLNNPNEELIEIENKEKEDN